jgi:hypothetical protein
MNKSDLINLWVFKAFLYLKNNRRGYQNQMVANGHFSSYLFSTQNPLQKISLQHAIRMIFNYALVCKNTEKVHEFKDDWNRIGDIIVRMADDGTIDKLNSMFKKEEKKKQEVQ